MNPWRDVHSVAVPLARANVDTDQISPARFLQKPRSADFSLFLFRDLRCDAHGMPRPDFVLNQSAYAAAQILVAGPNFGCGSSREHAVWALVDGGFRVVIAPSFGDIFHANALKNGLLPIRLEQPVVETLLAQLQRSPGLRIAVDLRSQTLRADGGSTTGFEIAPFGRHCLLEGLDEIAYTLSLRERIERFEQDMNAPFTIDTDISRP